MLAIRKIVVDRAPWGRSLGPSDPGALVVPIAIGVVTLMLGCRLGDG
ncbi:MAG TPA: hypothetical protein VNF73_11765 [Candidatus Saccharimonadales bacterium]|nr:hypothetical protein [Candidatus Saccharimonadales bacterium]